MAKTKEIFSPIEIAKNNKIAQKYIDYIMQDYRRKKNLFAVKISINDGYTSFWYKITDNPKESPGETYGGSQYMLIDISYIKNPWSWHSDRSGGRIEVQNNKDTILGRVINTGEVVEDKDGIKTKEAISYLNISASLSKKVIDFFINEYKKKYPQLSGSKYFNKHIILEVDPELADKLSTEYRTERQKQEDAADKNRREAKKFVNDNFTQSIDDIREYALSLKELGADTSIDRMIYSEDKGKYAISRIYSGGFETSHWSNRTGEYDCTDGKPYYLIEFKFINDGYELWVDDGNDDDVGADLDDPEFNRAVNTALGKENVEDGEDVTSQEIKSEIDRFLNRMKRNFELVDKNIKNYKDVTEYYLIFREK